MKKIFLISAMMMALALAPPINEAQAQKVIQYPFAAADSQSITLTSKTLADTFEVTNSLTYVDYGTLDTALAVNVTIASHVKLGAILVVKAKSDATARNITWGTGIDAAAMTGTGSKTKVQSFFYDGTQFIGLGAFNQID
ncbi:MAG: hypothetical protein JXA03_15520 [Bacteroidales bacterium]|nr:hypothetical protein [Bacteroidales bacterium]